LGGPGNQERRPVHLQACPKLSTDSVSQSIDGKRRLSVV
jgi:hypothetical protein